MFIKSYYFVMLKSRKAMLLCGFLCGKNRLIGGDGEIRTLVPVKANAFRVRPVMTTSIRLHVC